MKLLLDRELNGLPYRAYRFALRRLVKQVQPYHPVSMDGKLLSKGERALRFTWQGRWRRATGTAWCASSWVR